MRIGVVSDTHNHLGNVARIVELLNQARVECVVHTGDITQAKTLEVLARLQAPLLGVFGNNDRGERQALEQAAQRYDIALSDPPLELFASLRAPLYGVFGNNDVERDALDAAVARHGFTFVEPPFRLSWHDRSIVVVHDPRELDGFGPRTDVALHGHTHRHVLERNDGTIVFNPGECAGHVAGLNAVGIVDLATLTAEILRF